MLARVDVLHVRMATAGAAAELAAELPVVAAVRLELPLARDAGVAAGRLASRDAATAYGATSLIVASEAVDSGARSAGISREI
jgi:hypothetical protein